MLDEQLVIRVISVLSPHVTYPSAISMQVDFPSRHSNVIYDNGRTPSKAATSFETSRHTPTRFAQERSSSEFTSTRKLGGNTGSGISTSFEPSSSKAVTFDNDWLIN